MDPFPGCEQVYFDNGSSFTTNKTNMCGYNNFCTYKNKNNIINAHTTIFLMRRSDFIIRH